MATSEKRGEKGRRLQRLSCIKILDESPNAAVSGEKGRRLLRTSCFKIADESPDVAGGDGGAGAEEKRTPTHLLVTVNGIIGSTQEAKRVLAEARDPEKRPAFDVHLLTVLMFGISYGELFLILGATAALVGPKDLPRIARTAGRLAGRAIGYVQLARGQFESVMQQSQASKVHKELQDTIAQLEAIRYEIRSISIMNPGPFTRRLDSAEPTQSNGTIEVEKPNGDDGLKSTASQVFEDMNSVNTVSSSLHSQAMAYARLAEAPTVKLNSSANSEYADKLTIEGGPVTVLPVSAESAGLLPKRIDEAKGSDIVLEAILEAEVASNAKHFFSQPQNQLPHE